MYIIYITLVTWTVLQKVYFHHMGQHSNPTELPRLPGFLVLIPMFSGRNSIKILTWRFPKMGVPLNHPFWPHGTPEQKTSVTWGSWPWLGKSEWLLLINPETYSIWLVVWTPLKNISQFGWLFPIYGKIKLMFQTTNQVLVRMIPAIINQQRWITYTSPWFLASIPFLQWNPRLLW